MSEYAWFMDNLDDVRSDFSVYHRVGEIEEMPADRFAAYLRRLPVYGGAVALLIRQGPQEPQEPSQPPPLQHRQLSDVVDLMKTDPLFMGQGTYAQVPAE